jgi:hypothetical protein
VSVLEGGFSCTGVLTDMNKVPELIPIGRERAVVLLEQLVIVLGDMRGGYVEEGSDVWFFESGHG